MRKPNYVLIKLDTGRVHNSSMLCYELLEDSIEQIQKDRAFLMSNPHTSYSYKQIMSVLYDKLIEIYNHQTYLNQL